MSTRLRFRMIAITLLVLALLIVAWIIHPPTPSTAGYSATATYGAGLYHAQLTAQAALP